MFTIQDVESILIIIWILLQQKHCKINIFKTTLDKAIKNEDIKLLILNSLLNTSDTYQSF